MNILYNVREAAKALSMGRTRLFREIRDGQIEPLMRRPKVLFHRDELERYAKVLRDKAKSLKETCAVSSSTIAERISSTR